jgi:hypothetical protein
VDALFEDGLLLVDVELGLEVAQIVGVAAAVRSAARVSKVEVLVDYLLAGAAPTNPVLVKYLYM